MADNRTRTTELQGESKLFGTPTVRGDMAVKVLHSVNLSLIEYICRYYFNNDLTRFVWASNDYAFRRRVEQAGKKTQGLDMPFFNIRIANIEPGGDRPWANFAAQADGVAIYELSKKIHLTPIQITYDLTMFFQTEIESLYNVGALIWDASLEIKLTSSVDVTVTNADSSTTVYTLDNIGIMKPSVEYGGQFAENDWLEKNKIRTVSINPVIQTWLYGPNIRTRDKAESYGITKEFIFKLYENNDHDFVNNLVMDYSYLSS